MNQESLLLLGFGDIAQRLAMRLRDSYAVTGVRRSSINIEGISTVQTDCTNLSQMQTLLTTSFDVIVITMTPGEISDQGYQKAYVRTVDTCLEALQKQSWQPRLIIFVSSTGVYGQQSGEWVDEQSPADPRTFSGKRLLEAETLLRNSGYAHCVIRFSGIYGPGRRRLIDQVLAGHGTAKEPVLYSNRIHADDCAGVLAHMIQQQQNQPIASVYLATDCEPAPLYEVKCWLAEQLQRSPEQLQPKPVNRQFRSSKRVSNQLLLDSGYQFDYPTFREGYGQVLQELSTNLKKDNCP